MRNCSNTPPIIWARQTRNETIPVCASATEAGRQRPENLPIPHTAAHYSANTADRERLYVEFAPLVRHLVRQYGQDAEMRMDMAGEIYCRFCSLLDSFDPERGVPLRPYLVRQLSNGIYAYARQRWRLQRRESRWDATEGIAEQVMSFDPTQTWIASLSQKQVLASLPAALQKLPARQRDVVIWRYYEERPFEEIAQILGIQPATARSLLRHGLNNLRRQIKDEEGPTA